jgi:positive regulator of sigma E activity
MAIQTEQGVVLELVGGEQAKIKVSRRPSCRTCSLNGTCCEPLGHENMILLARNDPGARAGQEVQVEFEAVSRGKAMGVLYVIPLAALLVGAILGYNLELFGSRDASTALLSLVFLVVSFLGISFYNKATWAREAGLQPRIVHILSSRSMRSPESERE